MVISPGPAEYGQSGIASGNVLEIPADLIFRHRVREVILPLETQIFRNIQIQLFNGRDSGTVEHLPYIVRSMREICKRHGYSFSQNAIYAASSIRSSSSDGSDISTFMIQLA